MRERWKRINAWLDEPVRLPMSAYLGIGIFVGIGVIDVAATAQRAFAAQDFVYHGITVHRGPFVFRQREPRRCYR